MREKPQEIVTRLTPSWPLASEGVKRVLHSSILWLKMSCIVHKSIMSIQYVLGASVDRPLRLITDVGWIGSVGGASLEVAKRYVEAQGSAGEITRKAA